MDVLFDYVEDPVFCNNMRKRFKLKFRCSRGRQLWVNMRLYHPEYVTCVQGDVMGTYMQQFYHAMTESSFEIEIGEANSNVIDMVLELSVPGRAEKNFIPITLVKNQTTDVFE